MSASANREDAPRGRYLALLCLTALGVVYGDIGTSPLYAFRESFHASYGLVPAAPDVLGVLSLIFWSLILVISIKYLVLVLRADNEGEGGIIALAALVSPARLVRGSSRWLVVLAGLFGAALLYGDSVITPAISVLSAIEGLEVATPRFTPWVLPITIAILVALFLVQRRGTAGIGVLFGPVTLVWFAVLAVLGAVNAAANPGVFAAVDPRHAIDFFARHGGHGWLVLGSVFLVVTGGEALYADMGHFGIRPIRWTWFGFVLPSLLLNYFGQGALILSSPEAVENPFFLMAPRWALYPLVALSSAATVIASQAVISGAFSLTRQAVQLGYLPRVEIRQTSAREIGQIYVPAVNWALMIGCVVLVLSFRSSGALAAAYGVGVTTDMVFTTILFAVVTRVRWRWPLAASLAVCGALLAVDLAFWGANLPKIPSGGWFPLLVGAAVFTIMTTWKRGREILAARLKVGAVPLADFVADLGQREDEYVRVPGTAIYMSGSPGTTPPALVANLRHNRVLHETVVVLNVVVEDVPRVLPARRAVLERLGRGFWRVELHFGFVESPDVPAALASIVNDELDLAPERVSFFLGHERLFATPKPGMAIWRERLFVVLSRNARRASSFFSLPADRVIELGVQVEL